METSKIQNIYPKIANELSNIIPEEWKKILVYSEWREGYERIYFYYYPKNRVDPIYSLDIIDIFDIEEELIEETEMNLQRYFRELWAEYKNQEKCTYLTIKLEYTGKMSVEYGYENVSEVSPVDKQNEWIKKYL